MYSYHNNLTYQLHLSVSVYYKLKFVEYKLKTVLNNNKKDKLNNFHSRDRYISFNEQRINILINF